MGCQSRYGALPLPDSPRTQVFRAIDDVLRGDPTLGRVIRPSSWKSWQGGPEDKAEFAPLQAPAVRLTPIPEAETWWYPGSTKGGLVVLIEMLVDGLAVDDVENLFWTLQRALVPADHTAAMAIQKRLAAAGALTGEISFHPAKVEPQDAGAAGQFKAFGLAKIEVTSL